MKKSPIQLSPEIKKLAFEARFMTKLTGMYESLMEALAEVRDLARDVRAHAQRIQNLPPGPRGERGERGPTGVAKQPPTLEQILAKIPTPKDGVSPNVQDVAAEVMSLITLPENGKDAVIDQKAIVEELFEKITAKDFDWRKIPGLANEMASYRNQLAGKQYGKDTLIRGGGMTMSAGSNITLVPQPDGTVQINASGGGSGTNVTTQYQLTAVQAGANVTIDLTQLINFATLDDIIAVYRNNIMQTETLNFTQTPTEITIFDADAGEIFNITYGYA